MYSINLCNEKMCDQTVIDKINGTMYDNIQM
jgi:hypothetical protein